MQGDSYVEMPNGKKRYLSDLMSHQNEIMLDQKRMDIFQSIYVILKFSIGDRLPSKYDVLDIYGKIVINSFEIVLDDYMTEGIAQGLYLEASVFDHSCYPNAVWSYKGKHE